MITDASLDLVPSTRGRSTGRRWSVTMGSIAGSLSAFAFTALHGMLIIDIWDKAFAMTMSGALCGACISWSYGKLRNGPTPKTWLAYNGLHVILLNALGVASLLLLEPVASLTELNASADPLGDLVPTALPLMVTASLVGTAVLWTTFSRQLRSLPSVFIAHTLLVVLIGHNQAILGLVDLTDPTARIMSISGATLFLGASFAATHLILTGVYGQLAAGRGPWSSSWQRSSHRA